ncbi:MAG TPA: hypothetical protein GXZ36_04760 [Firmicutes bacterium]|nr:hypothetical protein [Bacillota bacterium]
MNTILHQICEKFIGEVTGFFSQDKVLALEEIETTLKKETNTFILEMVKAYLEQLDQAIISDKAERATRRAVWRGAVLC